MQNIGKTDINSHGSTSQQEHRHESPLKAATSRRQARLCAETKEQRQAKLETERDNGIDDDNRPPSKENIFMLKEDKGTNREIRLSQKIGFNVHTCNFKLVQDTDRRLFQFSSTLANDFNRTKRRNSDFMD